MSTDIIVNNTFGSKPQAIDTKIKPSVKTDGDNIFACYARKAGLNCFADFLRDDWVEKTAERAGFKGLANWLKDDEDSNFAENTAKWMVKHPLVTIASGVALFFAGKHIAKTIK